MFLPLNSTPPQSGFSILFIHLITVVFPVPLGPKIPSISPEATERDIFSKTGIFFLYPNEMFFIFFFIIVPSYCLKSDE